MGKLRPQCVGTHGCKRFTTIPALVSGIGCSLLGVSCYFNFRSVLKVFQSFPIGKQQQQRPPRSDQAALTTHSSEFLVLKQQLENSEQRVQALIDSNDDMRSEISRLSSMVNKVRCCFENPNNKNSILNLKLKSLIMFGFAR